MPKYILCRGCPASGKTTWAKSFIFENSLNETWRRSNRDDTRRHMYDFKLWKDYKFTKAKENQVTQEIKKQLEICNEANINIVDDNTNLTRFKDSIKLAESFGYDVEIKDFFDVHLHQLIKRDAEREWSVGEDVIHRMFRNQILLQKREVLNSPNLPGCIVVDVDGTVSDMGKGKSWGRNPYDWDKVDQDRPKTNVVQVVKLLVDSGENIIFLSGRDGQAKDKTEAWLKRNVTDGQHVMLFTRKEGDMRPDCIVKEEILKNYVLPYFNVKCCIEDRKQMTDHYRALGLEVWQVDSGRF